MCVCVWRVRHGTCCKVVWLKDEKKIKDAFAFFMLHFHPNEQEQNALDKL